MKNIHDKLLKIYFTDCFNMLHTKSPELYDFYVSSNITNIPRNTFRGVLTAYTMNISKLTILTVVAVK